MSDDNQSLDERAILTEIFGKTYTDQYYSNKTNLRSPDNDDLDFIFSCMQAVQKVHTLTQPNQEHNYLKLIDVAFKQEGEDAGKLGLEVFFGELLQNSLDHNHGGMHDKPIKINVEHYEDGGFSYSHNGCRFGFEEGEGKVSSTLTGLFQTYTALKKYDFRLGRFGIGFKLWTQLFNTLKTLSH